MTEVACFPDRNGAEKHATSARRLIYSLFIQVAIANHCLTPHRSHSSRVAKIDKECDQGGYPIELLLNTTDWMFKSKVTSN